jgi:CDP-archaeol synthase
LLIEVLALLVIANGTPVLAKKVFGSTWGWPLDAGVAFIDGQAVLGPTKTIRGIVTSVIVTSLCAIVIGLGWKVGALIATSAMLGDLLSSFVKRRLHLGSSSMAIGLDHLPECLLPFLACQLLLPINFVAIAAGTATFIIGALLLSPLLFKLGLRDEPY